MKAQVGKYKFGRHYNIWGIWQYTSVLADGSTMATHVKDVITYEDAVRETYRLNGWAQPATIRRAY